MSRPSILLDAAFMAARLAVSVSKRRLCDRAVITGLMGSDTGRSIRAAEAVDLAARFTAPRGFRTMAPNRRGPVAMAPARLRVWSAIPRPDLFDQRRVLFERNVRNRAEKLCRIRLDIQEGHRQLHHAHPVGQRVVDLLHEGGPTVL